MVTAGAPVQTAYSLTISFTSVYSSITNIYAPSDHSDMDAFLGDLSSLSPPPQRHELAHHW